MYIVLECCLLWICVFLYLCTKKTSNIFAFHTFGKKCYLYPYSHDDITAEIVLIQLHHAAPEIQIHPLISGFPPAGRGKRRRTGTGTGKGTGTGTGKATAAATRVDQKSREW